MNQLQRISSHKPSIRPVFDTPIKKELKVSQNNPEQIKSSENETKQKQRQNRAITMPNDPRIELTNSPVQDYRLYIQSPVAKIQNIQLQQIQNRQQQAQNQLNRRNSILNDRWDDSFKSLLKSNENYRKELLSAYEEKVKMQAENSKIQMEYVNLEFQKEELLAENKELQAKITNLNKSLSTAKENTRKSANKLEGDINRLKHQINLCTIDKQQLHKAYEESLAISKGQQLTIADKEKIIRDMATKNQELKGQITFLMNKINESEQEYFILEQKMCNANKTIENLEIKLNRAIDEASKHFSTIVAKQKQLNEFKFKKGEQIDERDKAIEHKQRQISKHQLKIRELNDQITHLRQENSNAKGLIQSLRYLEEENEKLRELPFVLEEFKRQNEQIIRQNIALKTQKEHIHDLFKNQSILLDQVSRQYEEFINISKAKEVEEQNLFDSEIRMLKLQIDDLHQELSFEKDRSEALAKQLTQKQNEANYTAQLIQKLQKLTEQKIQIIEKQVSEGKKLKESVQCKTEQTKQNKKVISDLNSTLRSEKEKWEYIANTNKCLLQERQKAIQLLNRQLLTEKNDKFEKQLQWQDLLSKNQHKQKLNSKQIELLKQKISQLQLSQRQLLKKIENKQQSIAKLQQANNNLRQSIKAEQDLKNRLQQQVKRLENDIKNQKDKQSQLSKTLIERQALIESKQMRNQDLHLELQQMKKLRQNDIMIQQAEKNLKYFQKQKDYEERYNKFQQLLKSIYKELTMYRNNIAQIRSFNFSNVQKILATLNSTQRYTLARQLQKFSQFTNKMTVIGTKIEQIIENIKSALEIREPNRNNLIIKQGNMYKINKYYSS